MKNDKQNRRSIRLKGYDYSQAGAILLPFARIIIFLFLANYRL